MTAPQQYRNLGKGKAVPFPISPEYVRAWSTPRAIVELIANALDEDRKATVRWENGVLTIEDGGPGIAQDAFLLGASKKTASQIGQFGEGKKLASLVLARDPDIGEIWFETVGYAFTPTIENHSPLDGIVPSRDGSSPATLVYTFYPFDRAVGTKITIQCAQEIADDAIARVLYLTQPGYTPPNRTPSIMLDGDPGRIYIGGILVTRDSRLCASYDLPLASAKGDQNRDRTFIDGRALDRHLREALANSSDPAVIEHFVSRALAKQPIAAQEQYFHAVNTYSVELAFRQIAGKLLPAGQRVYYRDKGAGADGLEAEAWLRESGVQLIDTELPGHQHEALMKLLGVERRRAAARTEVDRQERTTKWVDYKDLSEEQRQNLEHAVALIRSALGNDSIGRTRAYSETRQIGYATSGLYDQKSDTIGLHIDSLTQRDETISTVIHMTASRMAYLQKLTHHAGSQGLTRALTEIAATFLQAFTTAQTTAAGAATHTPPAKYSKPNRNEIARTRILNDTSPLRRRLAEILDQRMEELLAAHRTKSVVRVLRTIALNKVYWDVLHSPNPVGWRRNQGVSCLTDYDKITAIANLVGVNPAVVFLAHMAEEAPTYNRRGDGHSQRPWSGRIQGSVARAITDLETAGGIYAEQVPSIRAMANGETPSDKDGEWLRPIHILLEAEEERLS
ncbi:ATP-binding protein (plasmid) [Streptomyces viridifaciens]|nr:ATP-binding protein [Streptomyces viridifaciens]